MRPKPFTDAEFLGGRPVSQADPQRLQLMQAHLGPDERVRAVLPLKSSVLLLTDRRLLELEPHLEVHGPWNVIGFHGYSLANEVTRDEVTQMQIAEAPDEPGLVGRVHLRFGDTFGVWTEHASESTRKGVERLRELLHLPR